MRVSLFAAAALLLQPVHAESVIFDQLQPVHVFYQPLSSTKSSPLASIHFNVSSLESRVSSYTPPAAGDATTKPETSHPLFRISTNSVGDSTTISSLSTFNPTYMQTVALHLNDDGLVCAASFSADPLIPPPTSNTPTANLKVTLLPPNPGPTPKLNSRKPVVVGSDGKEIAQEPQVEKSFFQKYWWALALVAVLALTGGGDK